jgi:cob(I)alamin adenosyltransferase
MKIYTKGGDKGNTSLFNGKRVSKAALRIEAYGTIDELNSFIGFLHAQIEIENSKNQLIQIQTHLFEIGSWLANDTNDASKLPVLSDEEILFLENSIDKMELELEPLKNFILPGGNIQVSSAHICRTVCRRSERFVVRLQNEEQIPDHVVIFLNRLSDYFFVLARFIAKQTNAKEQPWKSKM